MSCQLIPSVSPKRRCGCPIDSPCVCKRCVMCNKTPQRPVWIFCNCTPPGYGRNRCFECLFLRSGEPKAFPAIPVEVTATIEEEDGEVSIKPVTTWKTMMCIECGWSYDPNFQTTADFVLPYEAHAIQYAHHMSNHVRSFTSFLCWSRECTLKWVDYTQLASHLTVSKTTQFCRRKEIQCGFCLLSIKGYAATYENMLLIHWKKDCEHLHCVGECETRGKFIEIQACVKTHVYSMDIERSQPSENANVLSPSLPSQMSDSLPPTPYILPCYQVLPPSPTLTHGFDSPTSMIMPRGGEADVCYE